MVGVKILLTALLLMLVAGCGGDNSLTNDGTGSTQTNNTVEVNGTKTLAFSGGSTQTLTTNKQTINIEVLGFDTDNTPLQSGTVKVAYPSKATTGVDVGSFAALSATFVSGKATFQYTAPENLQERVDAGDTGTTFGFYLSDDTTVSNNFTVTYSPEANQTVIKSYKLTQSLSSASYSMPLESTIQTSFSVEDDNGEAIADADVTSMTITLLNPLLAELISKNGTEADTLTFTNKNGETVNLQSNTKSGIVPIRVDADYIDANGDPQSLSKTFNMTILSGPPTAMSISYVGTRHDANISKFIDTVVVSVTDKYFNPVNTQPAVSGYLIAGYTREDTADITTRLIASPSSSAAGTLSPTAKTFTPTGVDLSNVNPIIDILLTFGTGLSHSGSGKWDIDSVNGGVLNLGDEVNATIDVTNLGFAIGHNYRNDTCRTFKGESIGTISMLSDTFDTTGNVQAEITFDYYLVDKDVMIGIDTIGFAAEQNATTKFGEAQLHTLRSVGLSPNETCVIPKNTTTPVQCTIAVQIDGTDQFLRNAAFGYAKVTTGSVSATVIDSSNYHIHDCSQSGGVAYVTFDAVNPDPNAAGTLTIGNITYGGEF